MGIDSPKGCVNQNNEAKCCVNQNNERQGYVNQIIETKYFSNMNMIMPFNCDCIR